MTNNELAETLWTKGAAHLIGAKALIDVAREEAAKQSRNDPEKIVFNGSHSASIHLLLGYCLELVLKAQFLLAGGKQSALRSKLGHDLMKIINETETVGYCDWPANLRWIAQKLTGPHLNHFFRYGHAETVELPALEITLPALDALTRKVGRNFL